MNDIRDLAVFVNVRLALVVVLAAGIATSVLGIINIFSTMSLNAFPFYVYAIAGALSFPLSVFALDYVGMELSEAVRFGSVFSATALFGLLFLSEGLAKIAGGVFELGVPALFYILSVSIIISTFLLVLAERLYSEGRRGRFSPGRSFRRN